MEDVQGVLAVIQGAVQNEIAGQRFYNDAAYHCIDPWAKEVFATLAGEEEKHALLLLGEYQSLRSEGRWLPPGTAQDLGGSVDVTQISFSSEKPGVELFPDGWSARQAIDRTSDDLAALAYGLAIERRSIILYQREADAATDPNAREAFSFLVDEERRHYRDLRSRWESIAGRSWPEDAFDGRLRGE